MSVFFPRIAAFGALLVLPAMLCAQVTHGVKPKLPPPFATKSAGNPPEEEKPPKGFRINIFAPDFKQPRWLPVAPNSDFFLADTHGGAIYILRDPQHTGGAQQRETFLSGLDEPFGIVFHDDYIYVGDTNAVLRYKLSPKTSTPPS